MTVHVAVVISGSFRTLLVCNGTLVSRVYRFNQFAYFHTFAALTVNKESERQFAERAVRESYPCVAAVRIDVDDHVTKMVRDEMPDVDALPKGRGTARGKALNIVKMFRGIWTAAQLLNGAEQRFSMQTECGALPKSKLQYDAILRVRPDLCFCKPLDLRGPMMAIMANKTPHDWCFSHALTHHPNSN